MSNFSLNVGIKFQLFSYKTFLMKIILFLYFDFPSKLGGQKSLLNARGPFIIVPILFITLKHKISVWFITDKFPLGNISDKFNFQLKLTRYTLSCLFFP